MDMRFRALLHDMQLNILGNMTEKAGNIKMPAYDVAYLDSMIKKHRYLFKLIGRNCEGSAFAVIDRYLRGEYRKRMDEGNPLYLNKTPKQILRIWVFEYSQIWKSVTDMTNLFLRGWQTFILIFNGNTRFHRNRPQKKFLRKIFTKNITHCMRLQ